VRLGVRLGKDVALGHREEPSLEARIGLVAPHLDDLGHGLVEHLAGDLRVVDAEPALRGGGRAAAEAQLEPSGGEQVEDGGPLGDAGRVVDRGRRVHDAGRDVDVLGERRHVAEERLVRRHVGVLGEEVVLGGPGVLEAGLVGRDHPVDLVAEPLVLGRRAVFVDQALGDVQRVEDAELHGPDSFRRGGGPGPAPKLERVLVF